MTGSGRGFPQLTLIPPWSGRRMHLLDPSSRFSPWNLDLRCWMNSCIARSRKTRQYFDFANLVLLSQWLHLRVFAPIVSSCIPNFVIFGFFDWWVRFLSVPAPNARHMARPNSPQLLTKSEDDSCFVLWSPQLPGGFGQNLPEIREQISYLSSENSEILEKLCYVKWGRLVWRNLAGVGTSWYVDELQLYGFHSSFRDFGEEAPKSIQKSHGICRFHCRADLCTRMTMVMVVHGASWCWCPLRKDRCCLEAGGVHGCPGCLQNRAGDVIDWDLLLPA